MIRKILVGALVFCSLTTLVFAAVQWSKFSYFKNTGGLNDILASTEIDDKEATDLQNVIFDTGGAIKKRFGYQNIPRSPISKVFSNAAAITGITYYKKDDGSRYIFGVTNTATGAAYAFSKTYAVGAGLPSGAWTDRTNALPTSYTDNQLVDFTIANNVLVFAIASTTPAKPYKWTGSGNTNTLTSDSDCPTASLVAYHKNILFVSGNTTFPSRLYFSSLTDITDFTATDFIDVNTSDGSKITAIISAFDSLYIFKDDSIWRLSGSDRDSFALEKMVDGTGTSSAKSVAVSGLIYFTTSQGDIAVYDGNYSVVFLSQKIRNTIGNSNFSRATNTLGLAFSTYKYVDNDYYVSNSTTGHTTNNQVLFFDTAYKAWSKFDGMNINAWTVGDSDAGQKEMIFGDYSGYVYLYPSTSCYDGDVSTAAISAYYQTKWFRYPDVSLSDKTWRRTKTYAVAEQTGGTLTLDARSDFETTGRIFDINLSQGGSLWDSATWDVDVWGGTLLTIKTNEIEKGKNLFQLKYSNSNVNECFTILGWESFIEPSDRI